MMQVDNSHTGPGMDAMEVDSQGLNQGDPASADLDSTAKLKVRGGCCVREGHRHAIYAVAWSNDIYSKMEKNNDDDSGNGHNNLPMIERFYRCFASVAGPKTAIYEVEIPDPKKPWTPNLRSGKFILCQSFYEPDPKEELYACAFGGRSFVSSWTNTTPQQPQKRIRLEGDNEDTKEQEEETSTDIPINEIDLEEEPNGPEFLCVGGKMYNIKVIDLARRKLWMTLSGHGDEIASLKFSPTDIHMLLSTSNDRSCRLWNVRNGTCVAILAGHHGHRDIVMSASWHPLGDKIVSGSHDTLVKIWDVGEGTKIRQSMEDSYKVPLQIHKNQTTVEARDPFKPVICQFPIYSTHLVHDQPVDCVEFAGDLVLSKSANEIVLWEPNYCNPDGNPKVTVPPPYALTALKTMVIEGIETSEMFYRFSLSPNGRFVAVGNAEAEVLIFDIDDYKGRDDKKLDMKQRLTTIVRMTAFSPDGKMLLCCADDGGIWKWDISVF